MEEMKLIPPFTRETAIQKVRAGEDAWNSRDPNRVCLNYTPDTEWQNRGKYITGHKEVIRFLTKKWKKELHYRLEKELWAFEGNRIAVRFEYEYQDKKGKWFRAYGNENWEFDENGLMQKRYACINDIAIKKKDRRIL